MGDSARVLFELIDQELQATTQATRNRIFSEYRDMSWSGAERASLAPLVERELDLLIQRILGIFDNVGGVLPTGVQGWTIVDDIDQADIRTNHDDYADMWLTYLHQRGRLDRLLR